MQIITGCTILRDSKGNPGEMILHRREAADEDEAQAYCRRFYELANRIDRMARNAPETCEASSGSAPLESEGFAVAGRASPARGVTAMIRREDEQRGGLDNALA